MKGFSLLLIGLLIHRKVITNLSPSCLLLFAVLQLCYNRLTRSIPIQLRYLKTLSVLALQYNQLTGAIPASLGEMKTLTRLDLSFNNLFGSVPAKLVEAPLLEVLDIRNNSLSGTIPQGDMFPELSCFCLFFRLRM